MKKNRKKYIFINMILFIIVSLIIMFFSKLDLQERFLGIGIMFFGNIICLLLFITPLITILLLNIYIKNNILNKDN